MKTSVETKLAFSVYENKDRYALLLGSGLSSSAGIPTGWNITLDLVKRVANLDGVTDQTDWKAWYKERHGEEPNYSKLLAELAKLPSERRAILERYLEPTDDERNEGKKLPTNAHRAIAKLVGACYFKVIITTNFDRLIENALREEGIEPTVVSSADTLKGAALIRESRCYLLKVHGDYKDSRILNIDSELKAYPPRINKLLGRILDEYGLITCGWSGEWDDALRSAIERTVYRRFSTFWAAHGTLSDKAVDVVRHRDAEVLQIAGADEFFGDLQQKVDALERSHQESPQNIDILLASTKRYLAKPEYRIQLDDLLDKETQRIVLELRDINRALRGLDHAPEQIQFYENIAEPLVKVAGIVGRWGNGDESESMFRVVRDLHECRNTPFGRGGTVPPEANAYPAVLAFLSYGMALTEAQRFHDLWLFFQRPLIKSGTRTDSLRIVDYLLPGCWDEGPHAYWDTDNRYGHRDDSVAFCDHVLSLLSSWDSSVFGSRASFDTAFRLFHMLGALEYFSRLPDEKLAPLRLMFSEEGRMPWIPDDGFCFPYDVWLRPLRQLESSFFQRRLLDAGFAKGDEKLLTLFVSNLDAGLRNRQSRHR
jgi:NAD-dependent SIR2 family protein deacetylase